MGMSEYEDDQRNVGQASGGPATLPSDDLDLKILQNLGDRVILKPLTRWNEAYKEFPRYVMEYLVSRYVQADNPVAGQAKIDRILTEHYAESAKKELIKSRIKEKGEYTLLGQFSVRLDQTRDHYWADVPDPDGHQTAPIAYIHPFP